MAENSPKLNYTNRQVITFVVTLSFICALILSLLASILEKPKEIAKELDRSKQMMIAAKMLSHDGYFLIEDKEGNYIPGKFEKGGLLVPGKTSDIPTRNELLEVYQKRLIPYLVDNQNNLVTFKTAGINEDEYLKEFRKTGYYRQPFKLIYAIMSNRAIFINSSQDFAERGKAGSKRSGLNEEDMASAMSDEEDRSGEAAAGKIPDEFMKAAPNSDDKKPIGYVIPVNGFGLWDAIYGYLAIKPDGDTVIGISWYDQKETPGLGANISEKYWQDLFPGKLIFQETPNGQTNFKTAPIGITVVKGKVSEVLGDSPKAKSAVDGMAGATLTGNGVQESYKSVLSAYRPFLIKLHEENKR